jgi:hypothetical protein
MTLAIALRTFSYSDDGLRSRKIAADEEFNCRPELFTGLEADGYVRAAGQDKMMRGAPETGAAVVIAAKPIEHVIEIPADWRSLSWPQRRSLASKLTDEAITNGETADRVILAELAKRGD